MQNIKNINVIYLLMLLVLNTSCLEEKETEPTQFDRISFSEMDTLRFTSGIHSIFQDSKGHYWFGSHGEGICHFDGKSYEYFTMLEGLSDDHILTIQEDKDGIIWIGTLNGGVNSYDGRQIRSHFVMETVDGTNSWTENKEDDLWFAAGIREGVYRYDGQKVDFLPFPNTSSINTSYAVTGYTGGKNVMLWFATYAGVIGYNGNDFTFINDETQGYDFSDDRIHVRSILEDSKGRLWIGNNGIGVLLKEGDSIINFSEKYNKLLPIKQFDANTERKQFTENTGLQAVFAIAEDSYGNIWFGDRDTGAWKYDGKSLVNYRIDEKLKSPMIWQIFEDQDKNLLFAMAYGGVYQFNGKLFERVF
ncbi:MAG: regulator [Saprospiraceae bacterium]|nr:regulator [Saprospiraceae bacterium]